MKPVWVRPGPKIRIKSSNKPCTGFDLSGVALYVKDTATPFNISFPLVTQTTIAKFMPMGVSHLHPAYLIVYYRYHVYEVCCSYLNEEFVVHLWTQVDRPEWMPPAA